MALPTGANRGGGGGPRRASRPTPPPWAGGGPCTRTSTSPLHLHLHTLNHSHSGRSGSESHGCLQRTVTAALAALSGQAPELHARLLDPLLHHRLHHHGGGGCTLLPKAGCTLSTKLGGGWGAELAQCSGPGCLRPRRLRCSAAGSQAARATTIDP